MSLIKGPFLVKVNDTVISNVSRIVYAEDKLGIDILISDYDEANFLLDKAHINRVYCIGCNSTNVGATYYTKKYKTGIIIEDHAVMVLRVIFDVWRAKVGEITE